MAETQSFTDYLREIGLIETEKNKDDGDECLTEDYADKTTTSSTEKVEIPIKIVPKKTSPVEDLKRRVKFYLTR